ncbi:MAG: hypothetical protein AMXMBFR6_18150 [Betaproteobacteria bacterium]
MIKPSGRTGTVIDSSGFRQTMIFTLSPAPIKYRYSDEAADGGAGGNCVAQPDIKDQAMAASVARAPLARLFDMHVNMSPASIMGEASRPNRLVYGPIGQFLLHFVTRVKRWQSTMT